MSSINLYTKEITVKVVYYGPGLGGKTTSLQYIHRALPAPLRGQLISLATAIDRTLYFDFLPVKLPKVKDFTIRMSLYTVPGQVHYNATRKLVLQGCDGVVFVADSQRARREANSESLHNLEDNLRGHGMNPETIPLVMQYNKRDLQGLLTIDELQAELNPRGLPAFESCALQGSGVFEAMRTITKLVLADLKKKGIYQDRPAKPAAGKAKRAPVVDPHVEAGLMGAFEAGGEDELPTHTEAGGPGRRLTFSELWPAGPGREQILALEGDIERGDYDSAVHRAEGVLHELLGPQVEDGPSLAEALLMAGVHGVHYTRLRDILGKSGPGKRDALFCLFFLADLELRLLAASAGLVE